MTLKEPDIQYDNKSSLAHALTWYSNERSKEDAKEYLLEYVQKYIPEFVSNVKNLPASNLIQTYGWLSRLVMRGVDDPSFHTKIHTYVFSLGCKKVVNQPVVKKYTKPEYDIDEFIGLMEEKIDEFMTNRTAFDINDEIKKQSVPSKCLKQIKEWSNEKISDFEDSVYTTEVEDDGVVPHTIQEKLYPVWFKDSQRQKLIQYLTVVATKKKKVKQISKPKRIDPNKQVSKMKYITEYADFKSVNPVHIIGAKLVVSYNTKYNVISILKANVADGLFVKGSSVYNYTETLGKKTLKSPLMNLKSFLNCPKDNIISLYESLSSKPSKLTGQFNEHTLILRVE